MATGSRRWWRLKPKHFPEFREWINAATGLAALFLAIVSFWTTARISGIEGYLRSEITRRNTDLDTLSRRAAQIEQIASARERQLASLDAATSEIVASSLSAQTQLSGAYDKLATVRNDVADARYQLAVAERARDGIRQNFASQSYSFELFQRQQALEMSAIELTFLTSALMFDRTWDKGPDQLSGREVIEQLSKLRNPTNQASMERYYRIIRQDTAKVCPSIVDWKPALPERPIRPPPLDIKFPKGATFADMQKITSETTARRDQEYADYQAKGSAYSKARMDGFSKINAIVNDCMCEALATDQFSKQQICPQRTGPARS